MSKVKTKDFKVVAVSSNTNSFGLYGHIFMAADGETWQVALNSINSRPKDSIVTIPEGLNTFWAWYSIGGEIPEKLPKAPKEVVKEVWG